MADHYLPLNSPSQFYSLMGNSDFLIDLQQALLGFKAFTVTPFRCDTFTVSRNESVSLDITPLWQQVYFQIFILAAVKWDMKDYIYIQYVLNQVGYFIIHTWKTDIFTAFLWWKIINITIFYQIIKYFANFSLKVIKCEIPDVIQRKERRDRIRNTFLP